MRVIRVHPVHHLSRILLGVVVTITLLTTSVPVRALEASGFTYEINGGSATVTGCISACPANLVIPETLDGYTVTSIGDRAFMFSFLTSVTIPDTITSIGIRSFSQNSLTNVTIPTSVTSIGDNAFSLNYVLANVTIPNSVTSIGDQAFYGNQLTSVTIPNSITSLNSEVFAYNPLTSVTIPNSVTSIGHAAFYSGRLTSITIPDSVTHIGSNSFDSNLLTSVIFPDSIIEISNRAFYYNRITSLYFKGNRPSMGGDTFTGNPLSSITRSASATGWEMTLFGIRVGIATRAIATVKPTITGAVRVGQTLTAKKGTWGGIPAPTYQYQWYACSTAVTAARSTAPSTCTAIAGATRSSFKLSAAQRNKYVAVLVTGTSLGTAATAWLSKTTTKIK